MASISTDSRGTFMVAPDSLVAVQGVECDLGVLGGALSVVGQVGHNEGDGIM